MRERIAQYILYNPRNKIIFTPKIDPNLHSVDVGFELASIIKNELVSPHLPMIAEDGFNSIMRKSIFHDEFIGEYIAISNWGILFEPELKLNILTLFDSYSKGQTLILVNCGDVDNECFYLVSKYFNTTLDLGTLTPYIIR